MVAEAALAPFVVIKSRNGAKLRRREEMIQTPTAAMAGYAPPGPTRLLARVAVQGSKGILVADFSQPRNDAQLSAIPFGSAIGTKAAPGVAGEGNHLTAR